VLPVVDGFGRRVKAGMHSFNIVDPGVKINSCYYREVLLTQQCYLPYDSCLATSCYNKTVHRRTGHARQLSCCRCIWIAWVWPACYRHLCPLLCISLNVISPYYVASE